MVYEISVSVSIHAAGKTVNVSQDNVASDPAYAQNLALMAATKAMEAMLDDR